MKMTNKATLFIIILSLFYYPITGFSNEPTASEKNTVSVQRSWIRLAPGNVKILAAYMDLINSGDLNYDLVNISSPLFERIEIHRSINSEGMAHMVHIPVFIISAHQTVKFNPGGLHLMLINPTKKFKPGDEVVLQLTFANQQSIKTTAIVRKHAPATTDAKQKKASGDTLNTHHKH